jgi:shikimate kinase
MTACGKSTVGAELASQLGYRFLDTDTLAEYMIEMPIAQFFQQEGEDKFRDMEHQVLSQLAQYTRVVVATGGGIVTRPSNWGLMQQGLIVYLDLSPEDIHKRLVAIPGEVSKRPLLAGSDALHRLTALAEARREKYCAADVHYVVDPLHTPAQTAEEVQRALLRCIADNPPRWRTWKERQEQRALDMAAVVSRNRTQRSSHMLLPSSGVCAYI